MLKGNRKKLWHSLGITVVLGLVVEGMLVEVGDVVVTTMFSDVVPERKHQVTSVNLQDTKLQLQS